MKLQTFEEFLNESATMERSEFTSFLDDIIKKNIKPFKTLKLVNDGRNSVYTSGYGGSRNEWSRQIINTEGDGILSLSVGWSSSNHFDQSRIPTKSDLFVHLYPKVNFHYASISVGGRTSSDVINKIDSNTIDSIKENIKSALIKKLQK